MTRVPRDCDVLVIGGGNAALCAAISARRSGAAVTLLEGAPRALRGGNARHSRNFRVMHPGPTPWTRGSYPAEDYRSDLDAVTDAATGAAADGTLARMLIADSAGIIDWMGRNGVRFQSGADDCLPHSRKTAFFLGGGKALVNALYTTAEGLGVAIHYDSEACALHLKDGLPSVTVGHPKGLQVVRARAVVVASGGFQANRGWLRDEWGEAADGFVIRGTPHATGTMLKALLAEGAQPVGAAGHCHMVAVDGRSPGFDAGIVTRLDGIPHGIVVNRDGRRFADEGSHTGPTRFSVWGDRVARCPGGVAFSIFDAASEARFRPSIFPAIRADGIGELAGKLGIDPAALEATVGSFNAALGSGGIGADGFAMGTEPPKTRLAAPLLVPPFGAYPVRAGVTSTCLGIRVDGKARVLRDGGQPICGVFAAGVIMAPNILGRGYLAGSAMSIGAVFGRIAGREAAAHALH
ncbi:FAD-dependent tricarballylate dehydrogenase TcuA [Azospirillum picis]|uniref:Tricarballylate dehydrogenase n=1 Tax=Azospirillum picis TaxID=488438 RepID=A0ABU0MJJ0_9PROT|nr:FAD-dependent tricarballylate dehydrogenase TcuA [Azospirillum picis]MBP2299444.1 tricarballylate dehydrogenase [Azospirillum picis]MDQ0533429.1 tricarballylate dehydrogenase [Azospirillum picis]